MRVGKTQILVTAPPLFRAKDGYGTIDLIASQMVTAPTQHMMEFLKMPFTNAEKQKRHSVRVKEALDRLQQLENATFTEAISLRGGLSKVTDEELEGLRVAIVSEQSARRGKSEQPESGQAKYARNPIFGSF